MKVLLFLLGMVIGYVVCEGLNREPKPVELGFGIADFSVSCNPDSIFEFGLVNKDLYDSIVIRINVE